MTPFKAACVQMRTGVSVERNVEEADKLVRMAATAGALYVQTPEMTSLMVRGRKRLFEQIASEDEDKALKHFRSLAQELEIWLHVGSLAIRVNQSEAANRGFLIRPDGSIGATYDKIHMFDVELDNAESYRESRTYRAGELSMTTDLPWARLGLAICYDLRFAHLFRDQALAGASMLSAPSAFTRQTGRAHWHILLRARAIENGAYMVAAAQGGTHQDGRETYGHSLIVDPWGTILVEAGEAPGIIVATIDPNHSVAARRAIPALASVATFRSASADLPADLLRAAS